MPSATYHLTNDDVLYYLHIPKTAGISFTDILRANFAPDEASLTVRISELVKTPPKVLAGYRVISGHHFYNIQFLTPRNPVYITMFRDPVERTISHYAHVRRSTAHFLHNIVESQSLLDFVKDKRTQPFYANTQTRYLAADPKTAELAKTMSAEALRNLELERQIEMYAPNNNFSDPALLERAQERLRQFAFVGITEQFDEAVDLLCYTFGWVAPPVPKILNVATNRPEQEDIPQEALDIIRANTQLDAALYETGKQLFQAHYDQMLQAHPENARPVEVLEDSEVSQLKRQLEFQKRLVSSLQEEKTTLEARIKSIETSFGWRFVLRFNAARRALIPKGSGLEQVYLKLRGR